MSLDQFNFAETPAATPVADFLMDLRKCMWQLQNQTEAIFGAIKGVFEAECGADLLDGKAVQEEDLAATWTAMSDDDRAVALTQMTQPERDFISGITQG